jgi:hypothetical protein
MRESAPRARIRAAQDFSRATNAQQGRRARRARLPAKRCAEIELRYVVYTTVHEAPLDDAGQRRFRVLRR